MCQLESELNNGNLTLHNMLFYVRPTLNTMQVIADMVTEIENVCKFIFYIMFIYNSKKTSFLEWLKRCPSFNANV